MTEDQKQLVVAIAERIRDGRPPDGLGLGAIAATKEAWRHSDLRADAEVIIDAFPHEFPLLGKRACE